MRRFLLPALMCLLLPMTAVHADSVKPLPLYEVALTDFGTLILCSKKSCEEFLPAPVTYDIGSRQPYFADGDIQIHGMVALAPPAIGFDDILDLVEDEMKADALGFDYWHDEKGGYVCVTSLRLALRDTRELCAYVAPVIDA